MQGDVVKEIERIAKEAQPPQELVIGDCHYSKQQLYAIVPPKEPTPNPLTIHTLSGLVAYLATMLDGKRDAAIHVLSPERVEVVSPLFGIHHQRHTYAVATYAPLLANAASSGPAFAFGKYMDLETFIIGLQVLFVETENRATLLRLLGNVKDEKVLGVADDGVSQSVTAKQGIAVVQNVVVPNPVVLQPRRTFREVEQPASPFVLRLKTGPEGTLPLASLWEADGGAWQLEAIKTVHRHLELELKYLIESRQKEGKPAPESEITILA